MSNVHFTKAYLCSQKVGELRSLGLKLGVSKLNRFNKLGLIDVILEFQDKPPSQLNDEHVGKSGSIVMFPSLSSTIKNPLEQIISQPKVVGKAPIINTPKKPSTSRVYCYTPDNSLSLSLMVTKLCAKLNSVGKSFQYYAARIEIYTTFTKGREEVSLRQFC